MSPARCDEHTPTPFMQQRMKVSDRQIGSLTMTDLLLPKSGSSVLKSLDSSKFHHKKRRSLVVRQSLDSVKSVDSKDTAERCASVCLKDPYAEIP